MDTVEAYDRCEQITRTAARNFSYGIRLLPGPKRRALSAVYAFARRVDDISDGDLSPEVKLARLTELRRDQLHGLHRPGEDPVLVALRHAARRFDLPLGAFDELIDGCMADASGTRYESFDDLVGYCRCVAGSIGRLSLAVFGTPDPGRDQPVADALGVALQLTNILRDVLEDRRNGRIYLPLADLRQFGCTLDLDADGNLADEPDRLLSLLLYQGARAEEWYAIGLRLLPELDPRSRACCAAMAGIYHRLLRRMMADPGSVIRTRTGLPDWEKAVVAVRSLAGARP